MTDDPRPEGESDDDLVRHMIENQIAPQIIGRHLGEPLWLRAAEWVISVAVTAFGWIAYLWLAHPSPSVFPWFVLWTVGVAWTWFGVGRINVLKAQRRRLDGQAEALWQALRAKRELDRQQQQEQEGAADGGG